MKHEGLNKKDVISYYRVFSQVNHDLKLEEKEGIKQIFPVDFSELFVYAFSNKYQKDRYGHLDYIFTKGGDYSLTLLPPSIFEIIRHYKDMMQLVKHYDSYKKVVDKYEHVREFYDINIKMYKDRNLELNRERQDLFKLLSDLKFVLDVTWDGTSILDEYHKNLGTALKMTKPLGELIKSDISNIHSDQNIFFSVYGELSKIQSRKHKTINNSVDADLAALTCGFNRKFLEKEKSYMDIFTGSRNPLSVLEKLPKLVEAAEWRTVDPYGIGIVRKPVYLFVRSTIYNEKSMEGFYSNKKVLNSLSIAHNYTEIKDEFMAISSKSKEEKRQPANIIKVTGWLEDFYFVLRVLFQNAFDTFSNLWKSDHYYNEIYKNKLEERVVPKMDFPSSRDKIWNNPSEIGNKVEKIIEAIKEDESAYEDSLMKFQEKIQEEVKSLYTDLYKYIDDFAPAMLSPAIIYYYKDIVEEFREKGWSHD